MHFTTAILLTLPVLALAAPRPVNARAPAPALAPSITAEQPTVTIERRAHARSFARRRRHDVSEPVVDIANADDEEPLAAASIVPRSHPRSFATRRARRTVAMASTAAAAEEDVPVAIPRRAHARAFPTNRRSDEDEDAAAELEERSHGVVGTPLAARSNERNHPRAWVGRAVN